MTREEAIKVMEYPIRKWLMDSSYDGVYEALDMVISVLREQEERSKGCEYCDGTETDLYFHEGACQQMNDLVYLSGNSLVCDFGCKVYASIEIKFCPMCGRKLEVDA